MRSISVTFLGLLLAFDALHHAAAGEPPKDVAKSVQRWIKELGDPNPEDRARAAESLGRLGPRAADAVPALIEALADSDILVQGSVIRALGATGKDQRPALQKVAIGAGIELHYAERGKGTAVIFVHGSLGDYSVWDGQLGAFAKSYRAISYSRRYNYPNTNTPRPNHSAVVEAEDLAALIKQLGLGKAHVLGHSYGAYAALFLAVKHPDLVRTLTLAEPPVVFAGERLDEAKERLVKRVRAAFEKDHPEDAVRIIVDSSRKGTYAKIPEPFRARLLRNAGELRALVTSDNMYPALDRDAVRKIAAPTLLLSGEKSPPSQKAIDGELEQLLPASVRRRVIIRGADHSMWFQQPEACRNAVLEFLRSK